MIKKVLYFGLGLADFLLETINNWAEKGEAYLEKQQQAELEVIDVVVGDTEEVFEEIEMVGEAQTATSASLSTAVTQDDLTTIIGIGPTFAKRLYAAGITTFAQLAAMTPEEVKEITKVADWQADPADWIAQAKVQQLVVA